MWADDAATSPRYWFPRPCPRATWWRAGAPAIDRVHAIEWSWLDRFIDCELFAYRFDGASFRKTPGGWISAETITPLAVDPVGPLLDKHRQAGIELRVVTDLLGLWDAVITRPGIEFSGIRLANARPRQV